MTKRIFNQTIFRPPHIQTFSEANIYQYKLFLISLSTGVSIQFLGRKLEVVSLNNSAVGSGQPAERKTKILGNIGLDIATDLREIEKQNTSRRISQG
jgi:hypothetical protein